MAIVNLDGNGSERKEEKKEEKKRKSIHPGVSWVTGGQLQCKKCSERFTYPYDDIIGKCYCGIWISYGRVVRWIRYSSAAVKVAGPGESFEMTAP